MDLYFVGIIEDASSFTTIVKDLTSLEHFKDRETTLTNLSLHSFARQGKIFIGLQQHGQDAYTEVRKILVLLSSACESLDGTGDLYLLQTNNILSNYIQKGRILEIPRNYAGR